MPFSLFFDNLKPLDLNRVKKLNPNDVGIVNNYFINSIPPSQDNEGVINFYLNNQHPNVIFTLDFTHSTKSEILAILPKLKPSSSVSDNIDLTMLIF